MSGLLWRRESKLYRTRQVTLHLVAYPTADNTGVMVSVVDGTFMVSVSKNASLDKPKNLLRVPGIPIQRVAPHPVEGLTPVQEELREGYIVIATREVMRLDYQPTGHRWDLPSADPDILDAIHDLEAEWRTYMPDFTNPTEMPKAAAKIAEICADLQAQYGLLLQVPIQRVYRALLEARRERELRIAGSEEAIQVLLRHNPESDS